MSVETAADLAGFFDSEEFAEGAVYTPPGGGEGVPCSVIVDRGQGRTNFDAGERTVSSAERSLRVRASEVTPRKGGTFAILDESGVATGEIIEVAGQPRLEETGAIWASELVVRT